MITVTKKFRFEYAHKLPNYDGDCCNVHGHRGECWVTVTGYCDPKTGMVVDFKELKQDIGPIIKKFDHAFLNDFMENPTAENMVRYIVREIKKIPKYHNTLTRVRVYETEDSFAEWAKC